MLVRDILSFPSLTATSFALHDIDLARAERTLASVETLIGDHGLPARAFATDDRREALDGCDFVICVFQVGGLEAYRHDVEIPREYGVDQPIGDTLGPGGIFRGLRTIAVLCELADDIRSVCPQALLIQYANPMAINCWATDRLGVRTVGLCHSVQHTSRMLARLIDVPYEEVTFDCAGVNHTAWFTTFRRGYEDLLPRIREAMIDHEAVDAEGDVYSGTYERVRTELLQLTGYFHTESSHHASEYWPWFRKDPDTVAEYLPHRWDWFEVYERGETGPPHEEVLERARCEGLEAGEEYGARIVDSIVTGVPRVVYGNVRNNGAISNLPADACVEVACLVDRNGVRPIRYGALPPACAALNTVQINVQRLTVEAALTGDRSLVHAAVALDPLTSAQLTLPQSREMVNRLFEAEAAWLPHSPVHPHAVGQTTA